MLLSAICERLVPRPCKVAEHALDRLPMRLPRILQELREARHCKGYVRSGGDGDVHEASYGLAIGDFAHARDVGGRRWGVEFGVGRGGHHRRAIWLSVCE